MLLRRLCALGTALLVVAATGTMASDRQAEWDSGKQAFADGDLDSALVYFETARDLGMKGPAVHYNIAVCQYRLGRYEDALETFGRIARDYPKMRGLAEYNMGLAQNRLGNVRSARQHFMLAYRQSTDDEKIRALAAGMLADTEEPLPSSWYGSIGLRAFRPGSAQASSRLLTTAWTSRNERGGSRTS